MFVWRVCTIGARPNRIPLPAATAKVKREDSRVHAEVDSFRNAGDVQQGSRPIGEDDAAKASEQRQQHRLGQPLAHEARMTGTDRHSYRHLATAGDAAGEEQAGNVGTGNEQHEPD